MSTKNSTKSNRYYNAVAWTIVGILVAALLPWAEDWNYDGPRLAILTVLVLLLSPTLLNWLAIVFFRFDPHANNRLISVVNNFLLFLAVCLDKIICVIPNNPYADGLYQHMHTQALNFMHYEERDRCEHVLENLQKQIENRLGDDSALLLDVYGVSISLFREADRHKECEQAISRFISLSEIHESTSAVTIATPMADLACYLAKMGKLKESEKAISKSTSLFDSIDDQAVKDFCRSSFLTNLGLAQCYNEKADKALTLLLDNQEFIIIKKKMGVESVDCAIGNCNLTWVYNELSMYQDSCSLCESTIDFCEKNKSWNDQIKMSILGNYAVALAGLNRASEATAIMNQHFPALIQLRSNCSPELAATYRAMAKIFESSGETAMATANYEKAIAILTDSIGADHPRTKRWSKELAAIRSM